MAFETGPSWRHLGALQLVMKLKINIPMRKRKARTSVDPSFESILSSSCKTTIDYVLKNLSDFILNEYVEYRGSVQKFQPGEITWLTLWAIKKGKKKKYRARRDSNQREIPATL